MGLAIWVAHFYQYTYHQYIKTNSKFKSNKVLISKKFTEITGIKTPDWDDLILEFKKDSLGYKNLYKN